MNRRGFTFIELIVGLAIMVMIATAVTPVVLGALDGARVATAVENLTSLSDALDAFEDDVQEHPGTLSQLAEQVGGYDRNVCDVQYKSGSGKGGTSAWVGPYLDRVVPGTGLPIGIGVAHDDLDRLGDKWRSGYLIITIDEVAADDVDALDQEMDNGDGWIGGSIRWVPIGAEPVTVYYFKPTPRC